MTIDIDTRLLSYIVWGLGTTLVYGMVLAKRRTAWRLHHDGRARRDLLTGLALFLTALASNLAILFVLFGEAGTGIRGLFVATALGAFSAAGVVMLGESAREEG